MKLYTYDLETYRNCFQFVGKFEDSEQVYTFEISDRKNERDQLLSHLDFLKNSNAIMCGFNNLAFDYPVLHEFMMSPWTFTPMTAYMKAQAIFDQGYGKNSFMIWQKDRLIPQVDWSKINHFDNNARRTSLKSLQFAMRSASVEDLPYDPDYDLTPDQMQNLLLYCIHDVTETEKFGRKCRHLLEMRKELLDNQTLTGDVLNFSDVKIGEQYMVNRIGKAKCYAGKEARSTKRDRIDFKNIVLPKIWYRTEEFNEVLEWFNKLTIYVSKNEKPQFKKVLGGIEFVFGLGGVHASVEKKKYEATSTHAIIDVDVSGMYVAVAISNGFAPEHLGEDFIRVYRQLQSDRAQYKKGTSMNAVLKLAGNGVYGKSSDIFSPFYDPQYTYQVTSNGQLQLLQLAEVFTLIPGLELIQANTDGITAYVPRAVLPYFELWKAIWEQDTGYKLEQVEYQSMWISDVNNYVAVGIDGKIKRKGKYWYPVDERDYEGVWNKDFSNLASIKAAERVMLDSRLRIGDVLRCLSNPFDFMLRYKTPGESKVYIGAVEQLKTVRYYVSKSGAPMRKVSPPRGPIGNYCRANKIDDREFNRIMGEIGPGIHDPRIHTKNKSMYAEVTTRIETGYLINSCNVASEFDFNNVDFDYYVHEAEKLVIK